jgi:hypothetical protein
MVTNRATPARETGRPFKNDAPDDPGRNRGPRVVNEA